MDKSSVEFTGEGFIEVLDGQNLLEAALSAGIPHFHTCGGNAKCSTCRVLVLEGTENLSLPGRDEKALNSQMQFPDNIRLACQATITGQPIKIRRVIRDESDIDLYVGNAAGAAAQQIGEEKELVLFFLDIRDSTGFIENHLAFDVIHIIRKLFSVFQRCIESNGGEIIETMGDGFYAVFGCERQSQFTVDAAIQAGLSIINEVKQLSDSYFVPYFNQKIEVGIGVHIGNVVSGEIKIGKSNHRIIMGLPVNIASRLQNATKELNNSFIISAAAYNTGSNLFRVNTSTALNLKGISERMNVFLIGKAYQ